MKKRKKKPPYGCCDISIPPPEFSECAPEIKICSFWLALDVHGCYIYNIWHWGFFQRACVGHNYQFDFDICVSLN